MSGWIVTYERRWRFYPRWMPWGIARSASYVQGGNFVYRD